MTTSFINLVTDLAHIEAVVADKSADAGQARAQKSSIAVDVILAVFDQSIPAEDVHTTLLENGIAKGTVSKIETVVAALRSGNLTPDQITTLYGAYKLAKGPQDPKPVKTEKVIVTKEVSVPAKYTKKGAFEYLIGLVDSEPDVDKALAISSKLLTEFTKLIGGVNKKLLASEEAE